MSSLVIEGGRPLSGTVSISGAKNAALPACIASLLTEEAVILHSVPQLRDISTILYTLGALGKRVVRNDSDVVIASGGCLSEEANAYSVRQMRASFLVLGPLVARLGRAIVPLPGGCAIGARPVDLHLSGLRQLGARLTERGGVVEVVADRLEGAHIDLPFPSVGATEQLVMAACLAKGETRITNAAVEPEVLDLLDLLTAMGAELCVEDRIIRIQGKTELTGAEHTLIPDRMEAGTMLLAGAITGGRVNVSPARPDHLQAFLHTLRKTGATISSGDGSIEIDAEPRPSPIAVETAPYPGFPTDLHPPFAACLTLGTGVSQLTEAVFERRFAYVHSLCRMGAKIVQDGRTLSIQGVDGLRGCEVEAPDIRGGAALVLAGLAASGTTSVTGLLHIDRGHGHLVEKLRALGASVERREASS